MKGTLNFNFPVLEDGKLGKLESITTKSDITIDPKSLEPIMPLIRARADNIEYSELAGTRTQRFKKLAETGHPGETPTLTVTYKATYHSH